MLIGYLNTYPQSLLAPATLYKHSPTQENVSRLVYLLSRHAVRLLIQRTGLYSKPHPVVQLFIPSKWRILCPLHLEILRFRFSPSDEASLKLLIYMSPDLLVKVL